MKIVKPQIQTLASDQEIEQLATSPIRDSFHRNMDGSLKANDLTNAKQILSVMLRPFGQTVIKYNDFAQQIEIVYPTDLQIGSFTIHTGAFNDDLISALISYADSQFIYQIRTDLAFQAVNDLAHANHYNPLKDYLNTAFKDWDQQDHLTGFMHKWLGVEQTEINVRMFAIWLVGAVTKVFQPTAKFDFVLLLQGAPGTGKTTFFNMLAIRPEWYTDNISDFKDKDNQAIMLGAWIVNDDEMKASKHTGFEDTKSFITETTLQFRAPYERTSRKYAKNFVIGMTTNDPIPLKDRTGNRRYFVLHPNADKRTADITDLSQTDQLHNEITQLWGQAVSLYRDAYSIFPTKAETKQIESLQNDYLASDDITDSLDDILADTLIGTHFSLRELLGQVIDRTGQQYLKPKERTTIRNEINMIMAANPDWQYANWSHLPGYTKIKA
ncbi:MAG: virulence-associated E family protein [Oenococcus sp.]|uniref:Bacteriophage helicase n=1 Tax=Oenococcus oeni TaxID=1247 RepID=A0AAQ2ZFE0_OENOE|nr:MULTISPECIES: virulence-associated E family protein [Oenococcus]MCV3297007.1 virulence-associated E family protein [Oenococcus kitaharae]SYW07847.1 Bacteriophage helicase [Oenococcus oeni]VDB97510.1 Bacteriophage helicase [Oenococcus oeni]